MTTMTLEKPARDYSRCYYLGDYEKNGYDDSDFVVTFWDDEAGRIESAEYGSTRYGGGWDYSRDLQREIPADVAERVREHIHANALAARTAAEIARVTEPTPGQMPFGARVRITKDSRKGCKTPYKAGEVGEVSGQYWFGQFYRNGYNHKTRANGRAGVRMVDGRTVFCATRVLRLDEEPDLARVAEQARGAKLGCPHAWWTNVNGNFAA